MPTPFLQEYEPLTDLLANVPRRVQKGVLMCDVTWTCADVTDHWIVIGTDAGIVYVYSRPYEALAHQLTSQVHCSLCVYCKKTPDDHSRITYIRISTVTKIQFICFSVIH